MSVQTDTNDYCCGLHAVCEKRTWREAATANLYFDDEELDAFRNRAADDFTEEEVEQFREVLYTMRLDEVPEWLECLKQRGIALPSELESESQLIISELAELG